MKYKILLINLGYFTGLNGSIFDYIFKSYRYIFPSKKTTGRISEKVKRIISAENPDVVCLIEIRKNQIKYLTGNGYNFYNIETKYSPSGLAKETPILKNQCNGFMSKDEASFKKIFIKNGSKKLLYIIDLPGETKLMLFHFALSEKTRKKQFIEIGQIAKGYKNLILCGDFNIFKGFSEVEPLMKNLDLNLCQEAPTMPAFNPKMPLDIFLASKNIQTKSKVVLSQISDHLPVILEIETQ